MTLGLQRTFPAVSSFLQNENRTIFHQDMAKNVKKNNKSGMGNIGAGALIGGGLYWGYYGMQF